MTHYIENEFLSVGVKEYGCELSGIRSVKTGFEYLWQGDESVWYGQAPILFPIVGTVLDNKYRVDGKEYEMLRTSALKLIRALEIEGGCNCQFAHDPKTGRIVVIEINPRTSRSSALASKATGFPIALVSAMLACGLTLDEIPCGKYGTLDKYYPDGDYVVIKFARWAFEKFHGAQDKLGTQMRAVGEVMSIGKTYKEAFQKAIRSLEKDRYGLGFAKDFNKLSKDELMLKLAQPSSERQFIMYEALRKGATVDELFELTRIKRWFIEQMKELVEEEEELLKNAGRIPDEKTMRQAKLDGFSDKYLSQLLGVSEDLIRRARYEYGIKEGWEGVHVSGTQDAAYYYSSYHIEDKSPSSNNKKIMILGGGPNRIGQGIEFDYCCVHAAIALKKLKLTGGLTAKPHAIFVKIAKPVAIVALILDIIFLAFWPILIGVTCGAAVCAAAGEAASSLVLF